MPSKVATSAAGKLVKLYVWSRCPYCQKAEIVATERGVPFEKVEVPLEMPDWYKKINPNESVPTLEIEEGNYLYESNLIAQYFDNVAAPAGALMGSTPYQRHRIEFFMSQVGDMISACYGLLRDPLNPKRREELDDNVAYIDNIVAETQETGGPFLLDGKFSMGDVAVLPFLIRFRTVLSYHSGYDLFAKGPHLKKLWAAGRERASVGKTTFSPNSYLEFYERLLPDDAITRAAGNGPILYGNEFCPFVDRARLACAVKGFKPHYVEVSLPVQPEWYKYINFRETVPTLVTKNGEYVHESQLIAQYVDQAVESGPKLVPRGDASKEYAVSYFITMAGSFVGAHYGFVRDNANPERRDELVWCIKEIQKLLEKKPFGEGPFYGGATWNAGDIALMPFLLRLKASTPELTGGYDAFAEFPFLEAYLKAGVESEAAQGIFKKPEEYLARSKAHLAQQKS